MAAGLCAELVCRICLPFWRPGVFFDPWWWSLYVAFRTLFGRVHHDDDDDGRKRRRRREKRTAPPPLVAPAMTCVLAGER